MALVLPGLDRRPAPRFREAAYVSIKEAILSGAIAAGEPLFEERLADALGISRTPVREALAILEHEGLLAPRVGRGLYIRELSRDDFVDLFTANEVVEPYLARRAAVMATDHDLEQMRATVDLGIRAASSLNVYDSLRSGREFHRTLGESAGNATLTRLVVCNEEQVDLYLVSLGDTALLSAEHMHASNQEHADILDAIAQRDPDAAGRLVIYHAQSLRRRFENIFRNPSANE
jgi:DNA-binding GntR family transcriptional regulator